jgi:putative ABC transport system ATP-binding protein
MSDQITLRNVGHFFNTPSGQITLFESLSNQFLQNQTYAIVGQSGVGKSSLLSLIAGLEPPCTGQVDFILNGSPVSSLSMRRESGFVFQQFHLMPELDAISNIALPLRLRGEKSASHIALEWLKKVGLSGRAHHKPNQLSGGEQQRVAIARAFVTKPRFIFADEPTGNLDGNTSQQIADLMFTFAKEQRSTLIVVTHSEKIAARADTSYQLENGQMACAA